MSLIDQTDFLKEENKTKNIIIQTLLETQSHFSRQSQKQEFIFNEKVSQEKTKTQKIRQHQIDF